MYPIHMHAFIKLHLIGDETKTISGIRVICADHYYCFLPLTCGGPGEFTDLPHLINHTIDKSINITQQTSYWRQSYVSNGK